MSAFHSKSLLSRSRTLGPVMALSWSALAVTALVFSIPYYFYHINRAFLKVPEEVAKLAGEPWTDETIRAAYKKYSTETSDFKQYLPPKQNRLYVVFGGSGLVGGWIVEHLLMRGEDPSCIRIADLQAPRRQRALEHNVPYYRTDVTDRTSVATVFDTPWSAEHANRPLTVFHTAAYIQPGARNEFMLPKFLEVNVQGTQNVLEASKAAGCDVFIVTSSASVAGKPVNFFFPPWKPYADNYVQFLGNADPVTENGTVYDFASCYAYSKTEAEKLVRAADDKRRRFRTGAIRPGHAIYGHGDENRNSVVYDYLVRAGYTSWMHHLIMQYVSAQNVSLAHLLLESRIHSADLGGRAYCVCDPGPPFRYSDLYRLLTILAHPATPVSFPPLPPIIPIMVAHLVGAYASFRRHKWLKWLKLSFMLPEPTGDLAWLQPGVLNHSTLHIVYDDSKARDELGYTPGMGSLEGLCLHLKEWNENVEARLAAGKPPKSVPGEVKDVGLVEKSIPMAPPVKVAA